MLVDYLAGLLRIEFEGMAKVCLSTFERKKTSTITRINKKILYPLVRLLKSNCYLFVKRI